MLFDRSPDSLASELIGLIHWIAAGAFWSVLTDYLAGVTAHYGEQTIPGDCTLLLVREVLGFIFYFFSLKLANLLTDMCVSVGYTSTVYEWSWQILADI